MDSSISDFKVIFEDEYILIVDKPAGLVVAPAETEKNITLAELIRDKYNINLERAGIVHRLDKDTSGVIVIAKSENALLNLQLQFKERKVKKMYIALVHGKAEKKGKIVGAIERNPENREKFYVCASGKEAETEYELVKYLKLTDETIKEIFPDFSKIQFKKLHTINYPMFSLLNCFPLTGRTHQIRVHLKHIGFPIVSDQKYGGRKTVRLDHRWCSRQFLHASSLELFHPENGERMVFEAKLPNDLEKALSILTDFKVN